MIQSTLQSWPWHAFGRTALAVTLALVLGLWAWNTLAQPFGAPELQFRHALAGGVLLGLARATLTHGRPRRHHALPT
jgi:hypothetical protein